MICTTIECGRRNNLKPICKYFEWKSTSNGDDCSLSLPLLLPSFHYRLTIVEHHKLWFQNFGPKSFVSHEVTLALGSKRFKWTTKGVGPSFDQPRNSMM
jgi:hypothetical protein